MTESPRAELPWTLLHGFLGRGESWKTFETHAGVPTWAPDLFGHGPIPPTAPGTNLSTECERLCAASPNLSVLVGYSMGARIALSMLLSTPERFAAAVLIGVHPGISEESERADRLSVEEGWTSRLTAEGMDEFVAWWETHPLFASQQELPAEVQDRQRGIRVSHFSEGIIGAIAALGLGQMPNQRTRWREIDTPVLLLTGAQDEKFCTLSAQLARQNKHAQHVVFEECGHNPVLEMPQRTVETIRRFLQTNDLEDS